MRTLESLDREIGAHRLQDLVEVVVSDNCSEDATPQYLEAFKPVSLKLRYYRQSHNLGFDGNIKFLYDIVASKYIWFMADDDLLLPKALETVVNAVRTATPDVLLFSFQQPPGMKTRTFDTKEPFEIVTEPASIINLVAKYPKLTIYVLRKVHFDKTQNDVLRQFLGQGYFFLDLAFSILEASAAPTLCVVPDQLAACDADYLQDVFDPGAILGSVKALSHPYVLKYMPNMPEEKKSSAYLSYVQFLFSYKTGALTAHNPKAYEDAIATVEFRVQELLRCPRSLIQYILLKFNLVSLYLLMRTAVNRFCDCILFQRRTGA